MTLLREFGAHLWLIEGPVVRAYGIPFPTRMAVVRLASGGLWLWSPVRLSGEVERAIRSLGEPLYAVEPNQLHHLALAEWVAAWPSLRLYAPPGLAKKRPDLRFIAELSAESPPEWRDEIDQVPVPGNSFMTEVIFFHRPSRTCLTGDLIQKHAEGDKNVWLRWFLKLSGVLGENGGTPLDGRWTFFRRAPAREAIERVLAWAPERLVIAHGACSSANGADVMRRAFRWLL
jgi:hypothetical protein